MKYWYLGGLSVWLLCFLSVMSCVPVEEKKEVPFDVSIGNPEIRNIYDLQIRQEKDSLLRYLKSENPSFRYAAARAFASYRDTTILDALMPLLTDADGQVREMAAYAVGQIGSQKAEGQLTSAFDGRDSARLYLEANSAILEAMGQIGTAQSLQALSTISTYQHSDTLLLLGQVRGIYRYALRNMIDPEGTATMMRYLTDVNMPSEVRLISAHYLHRAANLELSSYSKDLMTIWQGESDPDLRMCIATGIGKLKTPEAQKLLSESLQTESDYRVKCNILRALQAFDYASIVDLMLEFSKSTNPAIGEVASQYFVTQGREKDASRYKATMDLSRTWEAKTRLAEAANKGMSSMFTAPKTNLQKEILSHMAGASNVYEKAAWLKAYASELRNFESIPKYIAADQPAVIRTQAVQSLIDACKDKNFDAYFAGEGHLIRSQIGSYLANAMRTGDPGILALVAGAITDTKTGLKAVFNDRKADLSKALANLKLPAETETYIEISKALKEYGIDTPPIPDDQLSVKAMDWSVIDKLKPQSKVHIITSAGDIDVELYPERAPQSVSNFIQLASEGFFNGKAFHRVVPNFVVQTGCPRGDGFGSLDFTIRSEVDHGYYNDEGYLGMASAGPHTEGTQFFITHSPTPHLDGRYTLFGKVKSGMQVIH
nr:peptidylprolyl isomerase [Bacteroidota bacterium]